MLSVDTDSRISGINTRYLTEARGYWRADPKERGAYHSKDGMTAIGKSSRRIAGYRAKVTGSEQTRPAHR